MTRWIVKQPTGYWRAMEHEGDYDDADTLYEVRLTNGGAVVREVKPQ